MIEYKEITYAQKKELKQILFENKTSVMRIIDKLSESISADNREVILTFSDLPPDFIEKSIKYGVKFDDDTKIEDLNEIDLINHTINVFLKNFIPEFEKKS